MSANLVRHSKLAQSRDLRRWSQHWESGRDLLLEALEKDTGKSADEAFLLEWEAVTSAFKFLIDSVDDLFEPHEISSSLSVFLGRRQLLQRRLPRGRILIVGTWNFPIALHLVQILFARAAGNAVSFKPSPLTPNFADALGRIGGDLWSPDEFQVWNPKPEDCLNAIRERNFDLVMFTGGTEGALAFSRACGEAMIPFVGEASGSETALVVGTSNEGDIREHVDHLLWAIYHNSGQTCVSPRYWMVPSRLLEAFWTESKRALESQPASVDTRPRLVSPKGKEEHEKWQAWILKLGAERIVSSSRDEFSLLKLASLSLLPSDSPPTFGPSAVLVGYESLADVVAWIRRSPWSLMTTILGDVSSADQKILEGLDASIVSVGESIVAVGDAAVPFGGRGLSGYGVCHGVDGLLELTRSQTWVQAKPWPLSDKLGARPSWRLLPSLKKTAQALKSLQNVQRKLGL